MTAATAPRQFELTEFRSPRPHHHQAIQAAVQEALHLAGYGELRRVQVECDGESVTISGRVPTYYLKQLAQNIALDVPGIEHIRNELDVC